MSSRNSAIIGAVATAVAFALVSAGAQAAGPATSLSIQSSGSSAPTVRSMQRDTSDNERVTAGANETVEVLFADGTSVTLAPGSSVVIERYRYDRASHVGELQMRVESGAVRTVGGVLNNTSAIVLHAPGGTASLDNAVAFVEVADGATRVTLVAGRRITVQGGGETRTLDKPGTAVALQGSGSFNGAVVTVARADLERAANLVNPGLASGVVPTFVIDDAASPAAPAAPATQEDTTAKDVKVAVQVGNAGIPGGACAAGGCTAGAPNFDLGPLIGTIGNRQAGFTGGANWGEEYEQGSAIAIGTAINAPTPDYSTATDGHRNTTAQIFAANAATPFSITLSSTATPLTATTQAALSCVATDTACRTNPIVNLYNATTGVVYRVAGNFANGDHNNSIHIAFPGNVRDGSVFGYYDLLFDVPYDFQHPGVVSRDSFQAVAIDACKDGVNTCDPNNNPANFRPSQAPSLFSKYAFAPGVDGNGNVFYTGQTSYNIRALQTGFSRLDLNNLIATTSPNNFGSFCNLTSTVCQNFARLLYGPDDTGLNTNLFDDPNASNPTATTSSVTVRAVDSFLGVDASSTLPGDNQRFFYATGSVSGALHGGAPAQGATLDTFSLSAGLDPTESVQRAFLRPATLLNIAPAALRSSPLLVLNSAYTSTVASPSRALQYDFASTGSGASQSSTISVTLGTLTYDTASNSAQLSGRTVGSSAQAGATRYSGSIQSPIFSTAIGGGNPNLGNTGRVGYLVLENYDPVNAPNGGLERTIESGTPGTTNYADLRVGQVLAGGTQAAPAARTNLDLTGYAAGLVESPGATAGAAVDLLALASSNLQLTANAAQGTAGATLAASIGADAASLAFGSSRTGTAGLNAYTNVKEYAAMTGVAPTLNASAIADATSANAAIISGAPLVGTTTQGFTAGIDDATRAKLSTGTAGYKYLQWGFLLGDFTTAGGKTVHSHLTSWIAGKATPENTPLPSGTADYAGHVIASVSNGSQLYTSVGTFANHWDFATRAGTGSMNLDSQSYSLTTRLNGLQRNGNTLTSTSTTRFEGVINSASDSGNIGALTGSFVADPAGNSDAQLRAAVMGQFSLSRTLNGAAYRAVGTFGGERTGP
jgi:FecR protein